MLVRKSRGWLLLLAIISIALVLRFTRKDFPSYKYHFSDVHPHYPGIFFSQETIPCLENSVATVQSGGRLGNQILEYVSLWSLAALYGVSSFIPDQMHNKLNELFEKISLPSMEKFLTMYKNCDFEMISSAQEKEVLRKVDQTKIKLDDFMKAAKERKSMVVLQLCIILIETIVPLAPLLKREFSYRQIYRDYAQKTLWDLRNNVLKSYPDYEVVFVGMHVRRTDYKDQLQLLYGANEEASVMYYQHAAEWIIEKVHGWRYKLVFVVASDDPTWCTEQLIPHLQNTLPDQEVKFVGNGDILSPHYDLALLSACNHSVFAYGTFGMWTALMAGGHTVVFDVSSIGSTEAVSPAMQFATHLPNWQILS